MVKYVYVKNGDAVAQLDRIARADFRVSPNGPDAFVGSFLAATQDCSVTLVSRGGRSADMQSGHVHAHTRPGGRGTVGRAWQRIRFAVFLAGKIRATRPDRMICGSTGSQLLVSWAAARLMGVPIVHSRHNSLRELTRNPLNRLRRRLDIFLLRRVSAIVVHGPFLRDQLIACGVAREKLFEFDVRFPYTAQAVAAESRQVIYVGRIEAGKGVFDLLDAASSLMHDGIEFELQFVGSGTALSMLETRVAASRHAGHIRAVGPLPHTAVLDAMKGATVVIAPTRSEFPEGRCMVVLESMAMGVPVIAPNHGPFPYVVRHEQNGLLFQSNDAHSLQQCIRRFITDAALRSRLYSGAAVTSGEMKDMQTEFADALESAFNSADSGLA